MTIRKRKNGNGHNGNGHRINWFQMLVPYFTIPLLSGLVYLIASWATQGDTLKHHEAAIEQNQRDLKEARGEFSDKLGRLSEGIATLNTSVAVQGQVLGSIKEELQQQRRNK